MQLASLKGPLRSVLYTLKRQNVEQVKGVVVEQSVKEELLIYGALTHLNCALIFQFSAPGHAGAALVFI
jgi:hypothetical protein